MTEKQKEQDAGTQVATTLKSVDGAFDKEGKLAGIRIENVDGAVFGSVLGPAEAIKLLHTAIQISQHLPPIDPKEPGKEVYLNSEIADMEIWPGRGPNEIEFRIKAGGLRLAFWINLDMFLAHCKELISHLEPDPRIPSQLQ